MSKKKIINVHTHVFTSKFVPPFLAKTIVPWPLYYLIHTRWIVSLAQRYFKYQNSKQFPDKKNTDADWEAIYARRRRKRSKAVFHFNLKARPWLYIPFRIVVFWLSLVAGLYVIEFLTSILGLKDGIANTIATVKEWLASYHLYFELSTIWKVLWVVLVLIFVNWSRRTVWLLVKSVFPIFKKIISQKGLELLERYLLMGRFSFYGSQQKIAERALHQLPPGSDIVILPMDMEHMGAGKSKMTREMLATKKENLANGWTDADYTDTYKYQMRELWKFVDSRRRSNSEERYHPFLFLDPRRIAKEGSSFFDYTLVNGRMQLKDCFVKTYMEGREFSGFKMYPALGYYPFDEQLLPIWRYAVENNIPIMTHCIMGVIYYRGRKKKDWNFHPVFKQHYQDKRSNEPEPMLLARDKNVEIQYNFTHPLNYLCLLEKEFLTEVIKNCRDKRTQQLYGYNEQAGTIDFDLSTIKICLAHFGGELEWNKFLETDRDVYSRRIIKNPDEGISLMRNSKGNLSWTKINTLWHDTDWYSIICSLLMHYENMYSDLSYIISKPSIYPLLNHTLEKGADYEDQFKKYMAESSDNKKASHLKGRNRLRAHVLFGTDFYVVRNHGSDKDLFVEAKAAIDSESFELIACENTHNYLSRT